MTLSRREFGKAVIAAAPLAGAFATVRLAAATPLRVGVTTSSFRDLPRATGRDNLDDIIRALRSARVTDIELALANVEPAPPGRLRSEAVPRPIRV